MRGILGADVFINLLLVFIITTGLLLMNTNKKGTVKDPKAVELSLPKVHLPKGSLTGLPANSRKKQVTLSARKERGEILYYVDKNPVEHRGILNKMRASRFNSVKIRFDRNISYGLYVEILDLCKQAGINEIINVYTATDRP